MMALRLQCHHFILMAYTFDAHMRSIILSQDTFLYINIKIIMTLLLEPVFMGRFVMFVQDIILI